MKFANRPVLRALLTVFFAAVVALYVGVIVLIAAPASTSPYSGPLWTIAVTVAILVAAAVVSHILWLQKYYYFWKLRKQLTDLLHDSNLVELTHKNGLVVTVMQTLSPGVYAVAIGDEQYEIEPDDVSAIWQHTVTETLPNGALVDRPVRQFFLPARRTLFRRLVKYTR